METSECSAAKTVGLYTLGCRVNQYESQAIKEALEKEGITVTSASQRCDAYILNTCAVTAESVRKSRQMIRRVHTENPDAPILVTGCAAQLQRDKPAALPGVRFLTGNREKMEVAREAVRLLEAGEGAEGAVKTGEFSLVDAPFEPMQITSCERTRAYVKIEDGCNGRCAYCIIPTLRGRVRSKPIEDVLSEVRTLAENGYREVVLTGIETSAYQYGLDNLLATVSEIPSLVRIRLGSLNPAVLRPAWIRRIAELPNVMPHFHLSLQSGCDSVLARMRRGYTTSTVRTAVSALREAMPEVQFSADLIVGFPGESEAEFEETVAFLEEIGLLHLHVFPYSPRPGTEAAGMKDQVSEEIKNERVKRLQSLDRTMRQAQLLPFLAPEAEGLAVLFETYRDGIAVGHTPNFFEVAVPTDTDIRGEIRFVKMESITETGATGTLLPTDR